MGRQHFPPLRRRAYMMLLVHWFHLVRHRRMSRVVAGSLRRSAIGTNGPQCVKSGWVGPAAGALCGLNKR